MSACCDEQVTEPMQFEYRQPIRAISLGGACLITLAWLATCVMILHIGLPSAEWSVMLAGLLMLSFFWLPFVAYTWNCYLFLKTRYTISSTHLEARGPFFELRLGWQHIDKVQIQRSFWRGKIKAIRLLLPGRKRLTVGNMYSGNPFANGEAIFNTILAELKKRGIVLEETGRWPWMNPQDWHLPYISVALERALGRRAILVLKASLLSLVVGAVLFVIIVAIASW